MTPLRRRMLEDMGVRNLARNAQSAYVQQLAVYARHFQRSPEDLGPDEVRAYQVHLTQTRHSRRSRSAGISGHLRPDSSVILSGIRTTCRYERRE